MNGVQPPEEHSPPLAISPSAPVEHEQVSPVLSRLHALFHSTDTVTLSNSHPNSSEIANNNSHYEAPAGAGLRHARTEPLLSPGLGPREQPADRDAIKVLVVTWNMGDALPKGDLSVLLGDVPAYKASSTDTLGAIPRLPVENKHPYHIVVVAAQECPTPSGVPRGLGGGIMKGVGLKKDEAHKPHKDGNGHKDGGEETPRKGELGLNKDGRDSSLPSTVGSAVQTPILEDTFDFRIALVDEPRSHGQSPSPSPMPPHTPSPSTPTHKGGVVSKGWSAMLEEWLCGGPQRDGSLPSDSPLPSHPSSLLPDLTRTNTAPPASSSLTQPISIPISSPSPSPSPFHNPFHHALQHGRSPLARSQSSSSSPETENKGLGFLSPPNDERAFGRSSERHTEKHDEYLPETPKPQICRPYVNVAKERLLGLYLSVFVYKGCEHLVEGIDKDFVTAGLVGGRFGNKGGIGVSLNLAGHRMLFVNAHLAAHAERNDARLANIAKIKSELSLDCFLPPEDPRSQLEDITDRFDTTFWCGDLNFRVDISLLHAKWLLEQKKYSDALMFDQLRKVMGDPVTNPLPGFQEADISFMPTFKYDVWKSMRATNRELRRSIKRRRTIEGKHERPDLGTIPVPASLEHVTEGDGPEDNEENEERYEHEQSLTADEFSPEMEHHSTEGYTPHEPHENELEVVPDWQSINSSFAPSRSAAETEDDDDDEVNLGRSRSVNSQGVRHRALEIKQKSKQILGLFNMFPAAGRHPQGVTRNVGKRGTSVTRDADFSSRRTSLSSFRSLVIDEDLRSVSSSDDIGSAPLSVDAPRRGSVASVKLSSPPRVPGGRRLSLLRRNVSGRSAKIDENEEDDDFDDTVDRRVGVYDTSKKQRIPSWCDRVLWKTHIIPDPEDENEDDLSRTTEPKENPFHRLSIAFSRFGTHFGQPRRLTLDSPVERPLPPTPPPEVLAASPMSSPMLDTGADVGQEESFITLSRDSPPHRLMGRMSPPRISPNSVSPTLVYPTQGSPNPNVGISHRASDGDTIAPSSSLTQRRITIDSVGPVDVGKALPSPPVNGNTSSSPISVRIKTPTPTTSPSRRRSIGRRGSFGSPRRNKSADPAISPKASQLIALEHVNSTGHSLDDTRRKSAPTGPSAPPFEHMHTEPVNSGHLGLHSTPAANHTSNAFKKFLRELPGRLHSRASLFHPLDSPQIEPPASEVPRRHLAGEVDVLHYGTIDDTGMRQLEGRSDHRPAIFAAAVYV